MRSLPTFFLSAFYSLFSNSTDSSVYIFQGDQPSFNSIAPILSPEQAQLIFAQRLNVSDNHELGSPSESTLSYINQFGGKQKALFETSGSKIAELLLIVDGASPRTAQSFFEALSLKEPDFHISTKFSVSSQKNPFPGFQGLVQHLDQNDSLEAVINPNDKSYWHLNSKIIYFNLLDRIDRLNQLISAQAQLRRLSDQRDINFAVILVSESSRVTKSILDLSNSLAQKRQVAEESILSSPSITPLKNLQTSNSSTNTPFLKGVPPLCHKSLDACISSTRNCSGHGECSKKYGDRDNNGACFACQCRATNETVTWAQGTKKGWKIGYWGGSACHKKDVSSAFWLISLFTIVMLGTLSWGIGMLFNIGEDKLPGVIGAGVSSKSRKS